MSRSPMASRMASASCAGSITPTPSSSACTIQVLLTISNFSSPNSKVPAVRTRVMPSGSGPVTPSSSSSSANRSVTFSSSSLDSSESTSESTSSSVLESSDASSLDPSVSLASFLAPVALSDSPAPVSVVSSAVSSASSVLSTASAAESVASWPSFFFDFRFQNTASDLSIRPGMSVHTAVHCGSSRAVLGTVPNAEETPHHSALDQRCSRRRCDELLEGLRVGGSTAQATAGHTPVVVAGSGDHHAQITCDTAPVPGLFAVVRRMIGLDTAKARVNHAFDQLQGDRFVPGTFRTPRVGQGTHSPCRSDQFDGTDRIEGVPGRICQAARPDPPVESVLYVLGRARVDDRTGQVRAPDGVGVGVLVPARARDLQHPLPRHLDPVFLELGDHLLRPRSPVRANPPQFPLQCGLVRVEQIGQQMHTRSLVCTGQFHAGDESEPRGQVLGRLLDSTDRVVVGQGQYVQARGDRVPDDFGRGVGAVRYRAVGVQVDTHHAVIVRKPGEELFSRSPPVAPGPGRGTG